MKNIVIFVLLMTTIVVGYIAATSKLRLSLEGLTGKTEKIVRGDLTLPINATGEVRPARRIEVKSEASGEVIEILREAGDRVAPGDVIIRLQKDDEQRNVDRAQLELDINEARLEEAKLILRQAKTADLAVMKAQVAQLSAQLELAKFRFEKFKNLPEHQRGDDEMLERETAVSNLTAQLDAAKANEEKAEIAIPRAEQSVRQFEASYKTSQKNLADAQKRLNKTDITSPIDGMVSDIRTQVGEVIQGGKTTLTGGTVLAVLLDINRVIVRAEVDESDIGRVLEISPEWAKPGHDASLRLPDNLDEAVTKIEHQPTVSVESFREEEFLGVIERIFPEPRTLSGVVTYMVDVVISSANRTMLLPGMRADVEFTSQHVENAVLCPNEAVHEGPGGKLGVYVPRPSENPDEKPMEFIACEFGLDNGTYSEVKSGIDADAVVYVKLPRRPGKKDDD